MRLTVVARIPVADELHRVVLNRTDGYTLPVWGPGDVIRLGDETGGTASFPLCDGPESTDTSDHWSILANRVDDPACGSAGGPSLYPGDSVTAHGPQHPFHLAEAPIHVFVADRTGLVCLAPMITQLDLRGERWRLHLTESIGSLSVLLPEPRRDLTSDKSGTRDDQVGERVLMAWPEIDKLSDQASLYACADRATLDHVLHATASSRSASGLRRLQYAESTHLGPCPVPTPQADTNRCTITAARSGVDVAARRDEPILQTLRTAGVSVPTSCEAGICGTCETTVVEGSVDHRDEFLTDREKQSGETVMVCVSRCSSRRLVLDI